jgi:F420H(2)-dependent quinone reductase
MPQDRPKQLDSSVLPEVFKYAGKAQVWVYHRTGGRIGGKWRIGAGFRKPVPTLLLEHRGRKSGRVFVTPLLYMSDGADVVTASPDERTRLWPKLVELYADFDNYQNWTDREIPVVMLKPR